MAKLQIAVVLGSTRPHRNGPAVADWIVAQGQGRPAADYQLLDLADYHLPQYDEPEPPAAQAYHHETTRRWSAAVKRFDGFVFVTPEYNHSIPGVLKTAIDLLQVEWRDKAAALVGYGGVGGARAIEHLRGILSQMNIAHVGPSLNFLLAHDFEHYSTFTPGAYQVPLAAAMFDQLEAWSGALKPLRPAAAA
jgi:NAD(P)H-dependent FMN reductase